MRRRNRSGLAFLIVFGAILLYFLYVYQHSDVLLATRTDLEILTQQAAKSEIQNLKVVQEQEIPTGYVSYAIQGDKYMFFVSDVNAVQRSLTEVGLKYTLTDVQTENYFLRVILPILLLGVVMVLLFILFGGMMNPYAGEGNQGENKMLNFGKSRARKMTDKDRLITFKDVAGLEEEKEELFEIVDFLKDPAKYNDMGARIPKGVLLEGPPGTGKTLLAKAVAGESGVQFFSISGSDFVEMFVGVGASRVRDMFAQAKANMPCIVFIDEIDAVGRRRGAGMGGGHDEREQTLNQLLVEMDGFSANEGIIVMAATNRVDILDPALLRPGRFDRKVMVGRPDVKGRKEILGLHAKNKPLGDDVDLDRVAKTTAGFTGADLENLMNEAALGAVKAGRRYVRQTDLEEAFIKVGVGKEKKSRVIDEKERRITAYHESGHAILFHELPLMEAVHTISIIPTGRGAAGYTMMLPENDNMYMTKQKLLEHIMTSLGGRIAEEMIFGDVTTGASQDIKDATNAARTMVTEYGMSERLGMIHYGEEEQEVFLGRDLGHTKSYSDATAAAIDEEVKRIVDDCYAKAKAILEKNLTVLHRTAELLLEKEKITTSEFEALFEA